MDWDQTFEDAVRPSLPGLSPDTPLSPDAMLPAYGMDSIGMVTAVTALEDGYGITFPDELLVPATFRTAASAWSAVRELLVRREVR